MALPALRTVRAVLPHTALQSVVASSGVSHDGPSCGNGCPVRLARKSGYGSLHGYHSDLLWRRCQRRHHALRRRRGFRPRTSASICNRFSPYGHSRCSLASALHHASTFLPPFPRGGFASRPSPRPKPHRGNMKALTPAAHTPGRQVSPLTPPCRPGIPTSTTQSARWSLCQSPQRQRLLPGFATDEQARHSITPNQVRPPTDCRFTSGCSPPRLAATQLPSISEPATGSGTDLHRADKASSRTHSSRRRPGPTALQLPSCQAAAISYGSGKVQERGAIGPRPSPG